MASNILDVPIMCSPASTRLINCLRNMGCKTLRDGAMLVNEELRLIPNFGEKSLAELRAWLAGDLEAAQKAATSLRRPNAFKRRQNALRLHEAGLTYSAVGNELGVTASRARQIVKAAKLDRTNTDDEQYSGQERERKMKTYSITLSGEEAAMLDELTDILGSEDAAVGRAIRYLEEYIVPGKVNIKSYYDKDKYLRTSAADRKAKEAGEARSTEG